MKMEPSAGTNMKKYADFINEEMGKPKVTYDKARKWVFNRIEKTDHTKKLVEIPNAEFNIKCFVHCSKCHTRLRRCDGLDYISWTDQKI